MLVIYIVYFLFSLDTNVCNVEQNPRVAKVSKFDNKYLTDDIFARKVSSKVDFEIIPCAEEEQDIVEVFAIDKKEPSDWFRAWKVIPAPSHGIVDLSDVIVKIKPGEAPSHGIVDLSDVIVKIEPGEGCRECVEASGTLQYVGSSSAGINEYDGKTEVIVKVEPGELGTGNVEGNEVQYVGSSLSGLPNTDATKQKRDMMKSLLNAKMVLVKSLASESTRSNLKKVLNEKLTQEASLSRKKEFDKYCQGLSPSDMTDYLTWDDGVPTAKTGNDGDNGDPDVFCTPTKRTQGPNEFCTPTKKLSFNTGPLTPTTREEWTDTLPNVGERDNNEIETDVRPQTREKLLLKKKKQMEEKTK
jgi:hypothetical protein